jgi:hypothetical protein
VRWLDAGDPSARLAAVAGGRRAKRTMYRPGVIARIGEDRDDELIRVIGNFPIRTLAAFPGLGIDHSTVDHLLGRLQPQ